MMSSGNLDSDPNSPLQSFGRVSSVAPTIVVDLTLSDPEDSSTIDCEQLSAPVAPLKRRLPPLDTPLTSVESTPEASLQPMLKKPRATVSNPSEGRNSSKLWKPFLFFGHELRPTVAFDKIVEWINERQILFENRIQGLPSSQWTTNKVLRNYRFCNVYRFLDRCCQFLIREVIENPTYPTSPTEVIFRVVLYSYFTKPATWNSLVRKLGGRQNMCWSQFDEHVWRSYLDDIKDANGSLYTSAFQVPAPPPAFESTHYWHMSQLSEIMKHLPGVVKNAAYAADILLYLGEFRNMGSFISYQLFLNLSYTSLIGSKFHYDDVVVAGVGCKSGLRKIFGKSLEEAQAGWGGARDDAHIERLLVRWFCQNQKDILNSDPRYTWKGFQGMEMRVEDWEHAICEVDKYCRAVLPDRSTGGGARIKLRYSPPSRSHSTFIPSCYIPQSWNSRSSILPQPKCSPTMASVSNLEDEATTYILERISAHRRDKDGDWEVRCWWMFWDEVGNEGDPTWEPIGDIPQAVVDRYRSSLRYRGLKVPF